MNNLKEQLLKLYTPEVLDRLVEESIKYKIKVGTYSPQEEWSPGSEDMIKSFTRCAVDHQFKQALELLETIDKFELNGEVAQ